MARPTDLRKFQEELARRIASADRAASAGRRLAFRAGSASWLVALPDAGEVLPVPALTAVPLTQGWLRGMANVRGNLYAVVDLAAFLGERQTPSGPRNRLLLVGQRHAMNSALLVDPPALPPNPPSVAFTPWATGIRSGMPPALSCGMAAVDPVTRSTSIADLLESTDSTAGSPVEPGVATQSASRKSGRSSPSTVMAVMLTRPLSTSGRAAA